MQLEHRLIDSYDTDDLIIIVIKQLIIIELRLMLLIELVVLLPLASYLLRWSAA